MPLRRQRHTRAVEDLRLAIDCLPVRTREAMLRGVLSERHIIVGAYVDGEGGVCPMLAAHRRGGRTDLLSFARSWDRFTRAGRRARRATERERSILVGQLQASLAGEARVDLAGAISEHRELRSRRSFARDRHAAAREADPTGEIVVRRLRLPRLRRRREHAAALVR
jgi:hypothetical protein